MRVAVNQPQDEARLIEVWRELLDRHARTTSALERSLPRTTPNVCKPNAIVT